MPVTHTHRLDESSPNNHVDSTGKEFGNAEHVKAWGAAKAAPSAEVEHTHANISVEHVHGGPAWTYTGK